MHGLLILTILSLLTACGRDPASGIALNADSKTGEISMRGEKGDAGEQGEIGQSGKDGAKGEKGDTGSVGKDGAKGEKGETGAAGKDGEPTPSSVWKDPLTGKWWVHIEGKFDADSIGSLCGSWKLPNTQEFVEAFRHGVVSGRPMSAPATTERVWVTEVEPVTNNQRFVRVIDNASPNTWGTFGYDFRYTFGRVYCVKQ